MNSSLISATNLPAAKPASLGLPNIAFVGKAGAGKTTAARLLKELDYYLLSFATPLKNIAEDLWGDSGKDRDKLQRLGVAVREIDSDTWVNVMLCKLDLAVPPYVVDDCRFENEWFALKAEGFVIVRIMCELNARIDRLKANGKWQSEEQLTHESETAIDHLKADYQIHNDSADTKQDLYNQLVEVLLKERKRR